MSASAELASERVLVLAPTGRDAPMIRERLVAAGLGCELCPDLATLLAGLSAGAGAAVVAQEALPPAGAERLLRALEAQEPWSDLPVLLLTDARARSHPIPVAFERANVTLLQRPLGVGLFLSSVRSAVRARRRQYQMRDLHRELAHALQLGDLFVGILGHDLRTPITAIKLSAGTILRGSHDPQALRPAARIVAAADRTDRMIEQLLDFARVRQRQGIPIHPAATDLGEVCGQVLEELEAAHTDAILRVSRDGPVTGLWDADRLAQVFSNLLGNAVQHGSPGEPIRIGLDGTRPDEVRVRVHNSGAIPAEAVPTLFEPFKRAAAPDEGLRRTGLGLGLFIARAIAVAHGGTLDVRTGDGVTTFELSLPRVSATTGRPPAT